MNNAADFDLFVAIVDAASVSDAARTLGIPRATLSRRLARLEERLGVRLLHRSTRRMTLTRAGEALYPRARSLMESANAAVESVQRLDNVPRGLLRISAAPLQSPFVGALVGEFALAHPEVQVELRTTSEHIDLAAEQIDVALRGGTIRERSLIARTLLRSDMLAVASPAYLARRGTPTSVAELAEHACLRGFVAGSRPAKAWPLREGGRVPVSGPMVSNDAMALRGAAAAGLGIGLVPRGLIRADLRTGGLVPVLERVVGLDVALSLVWVERAYLDPKLRAFIDHAVQWAQDGRFEPEGPGAREG